MSAPIDFLDHSERSSLIGRFSALAEVDIEAAVTFARAHARVGSKVRATRLANRAARAIRECAEAGWIGDLRESEEQALTMLGTLLVRTEEEIAAAEIQATERVWAIRAAGSTEPISFGNWVELAVLKYPDVADDSGPWASGYATGILAGLRWCLGDGWSADT